MEKILVIRLSSFGDIVQASSCLEKLKTRFPDSQIDWLVRRDFLGLLKANPYLNDIYSIEKGGGFLELWQIYQRLRQNRYSHIYDAHNNTRSNLLLLLLLPFLLLQGINLVQRPKNRFKRFLLFRFKINRFPWPFVLVKSYLEPLAPWGIDKSLPKGSSLVISVEASHSLLSKVPELGNMDYICLAPSAAWELKRWPKENWQSVIDLWTGENLVLLGGPEDSFVEEFIANSKPRTGLLLNLAGKLNLEESCACISKAKLMVGGDSGLTHVADSLHIACFCLIGAAAFAYPAYESTTIFDYKLPCKPCSKDGRGKCKNTLYKACLKGITPEMLDAKWKQINS